LHQVVRSSPVANYTDPLTPIQTIQRIKLMQLNYDGPIEIATGRSRKELNWKNKEMQYSELVKKLSVTHRTAETFAEYLSSKKPRQDEIKDIGGFVGGYLTKGRRKVGSVIHRQLITLDADFGHISLWEDFLLCYGNAAVLYSTHKHSTDHPRYRIIIPLDRPVQADEYVAISRRVAGVISIDAFDQTTFQPERLMYWPSTSKDGVYEFQYQDGPWMNADEILGSYRDWRDSSEWPVSDRDHNIIQRSIKKQGDPLEKPGIVGAFCRTYSISEVLENFLSDEYEACDVENRYTYKEGSTAAGLVVYDDKYAYSHHGTDPVSGKLCNAFDLVRLHKFGLKDEDVKEGTKVTALPSFQAMQQFAMSDARVVKQRSQELLQSAEDDFAGISEDDQEPEETDDAWTALLKVDGKGNFLSTIDNIFLIIENDPKLKNRLFMNEFEGRLFVKRKLPWRDVTESTRDFTDDDADCLAHYLEKKNMPFTHIQKALAKVRTEHRFHPVREYLNALSWDRNERIDTLFVDYLGAEDNEYTRRVARITLIAAIARVMTPGVKFDTVLTFVGKEGIGKSTLVAKLAGKWFSDCLGDIHTKEGMESLRGVWIMEIAELASFRKADQEAIKRFITSTEDVYRPAYGRQLVRYPRQCIFFATTNKRDFLTGSNGNRRFLPVDTHVQDPTKNVFEHLTTYEIDQIWAEALHAFRSGEQINLPFELYQKAEEVRDSHSEMDDRAGMIESYLNMLLPEDWNQRSIMERKTYLHEDEDIRAEGVHARTQVCVAEIWCEALGGLHRDMTTQNTKYIHDIMKRMKGWEMSKHPKRCGVYGTQRAYVFAGKADKRYVNKHVNTA
jgi:putative DNA primase/helicase